VKIVSAPQAIDELLATGRLFQRRIEASFSFWHLRKTGAGLVPPLEIQLHLSECEVDDLDLACVAFQNQVVMENTLVRKTSMHATYFLGGASVRSCQFQGDVDFQAGGHNSENAIVGLYDTVFHGFVNFADCWFFGPVEVRRCRFMKGTNLLGNRGRSGTEVQFDGAYLVDENVGDVAKDGEEAA
jgi:hypothetical protein